MKMTKEYKNYVQGFRDGVNNSMTDLENNKNFLLDISENKNILFSNIIKAIEQEKEFQLKYMTSDNAVEFQEIKNKYLESSIDRDEFKRFIGL